MATDVACRSSTTATPLLANARAVAGDRGTARRDAEENDVLSEASVATLLVAQPGNLSFDKASREVARSSYRSGGSSMRVALRQARDAERKARKHALQEQVARGLEREELGQQRASHAAWRDESARALAASLASHASTIAMRCDTGLPRAEAREVREALEAMRELVGRQHSSLARAEIAHEKACGVLQQVGMEREVRLVRLGCDETMAAAGILMRQKLQRAKVCSCIASPSTTSQSLPASASSICSLPLPPHSRCLPLPSSKVTARVLIAAASWRDRGRLSRLRTALREAVSRIRVAKRDTNRYVPSAGDGPARVYSYAPRRLPPCHSRAPPRRLPPCRC